MVACQDTQAIIYAPLGMARYHLAQRNSCRRSLAALVPLTPTRAFPPTAPHAGGWGGAYHLATRLVAEQLGWRPFRRRLNHWRHQTSAWRQ